MDIRTRLNRCCGKPIGGYNCHDGMRCTDCFDKLEGLRELERLTGALRTIDKLIPKTKDITTLPHWVAIAGDVAEGALNGTWPAYGVMPESAKEDK